MELLAEASHGRLQSSMERRTLSCLLALLVRAVASHVLSRSLPLRCAAPRASVAAVAADPVLPSASLLGRVQSVWADNGLVAVKPEARGQARVGSLVRFSSGALGVLIAERCGMYFAASVEGGLPAEAETTELLDANLTVAAWDGKDATWGGAHDSLGRPLGASTATGAAAADGAEVFAEPVSAARRRPIGASLHTGIVAIDALTPIGRGQSMMVFGPDTLPAGSRRSDVATRTLIAQSSLSSGVRCVLVLTDGSAEEQQARVAELEAAGALGNTKVLTASSPIDGLVAASAACAIAESCDDTYDTPGAAPASCRSGALCCRARPSICPLPRQSRSPARPPAHSCLCTPAARDAHLT